MKLQPKFLFPYLCVSVIESLKCVCDKVLHGAVAGVMCPEEHLRVPVPGRALESLLAAAGQDVPERSAAERSVSARGCAQLAVIYAPLS